MLWTGPKSHAAQRKIVPMNHFGAPRNAEQKQNVSGWSALELFRIGGVIGHETPTDLGAVWAAHNDSVAAGELPVDPNDADRQQAVAAPQRRHRTGIDGERALRLQRAGDPLFAGRYRV